MASPPWPKKASLVFAATHRPLLRESLTARPQAKHVSPFLQQRCVCHHDDVGNFAVFVDGRGLLNVRIGDCRFGFRGHPGDNLLLKPRIAFKVLPSFWLVGVLRRQQQSLERVSVSQWSNERFAR